MRVKLLTGLAAAVCVLGLAGVGVGAGGQGQAAHGRGHGLRLTARSDYHWWGDYDIGKGMADQVVDELVERRARSA